MPVGGRGGGIFYYFFEHITFSFIFYLFSIMERIKKELKNLKTKRNFSFKSLKTL